MRFQFQERPWDLIVILSYTLIVASAFLALNLGNLLSILLLLFAPGYVLVAYLFPWESKVDWLERLVLAFGLSLCVVPLLILTLNFTPFGIRPMTEIATIALFTTFVGLVAWRRRMQIPPGERLSMTVNLSIPRWKEYSMLDKSLTVVLAVGFVVALGALISVALTPVPGERYTEFYLLGPTGNASGYPTALNVSQPGTVILGIANHEAAGVNYTVRFDLVGVRIVYNATSGFNETVEVNRTTWSTVNVALANRQNWTQPYTFRINYAGLWKVQFLLFKDDDLSSAYRELHRYVRVT